MKIILEGTETEFRTMLHFFGIPKEIVFDDGSQFICGDIAGRGHRQKQAERTFKELKAKIKGKANDFSADNGNVSRPPEMIEYASRDVIAFPDEVRNQSKVDINELAKAINNIPIPRASSKIRNLKLSELIYLFAERNGGD